MDELPEGDDRADVLREIAAALPMEPALPEPLPDAPAMPEAVPPAPEAPPRPTSVRPLPRPTWWTLHRHELAGLVTAAVSLVWMSLGVASREWPPSLVGVAFALGALQIGNRAVWTGR